MSARRLTRRSLLALGAGTVAGGLGRPGTVLAALAGPPRPLLRERALGSLAPTVTTVRLQASADLVGVRWSGPADVAVALRFRGEGGRFSEWASAGAHGHGPDAVRAGGWQTGEPVWTGGTTVVQLRSSRRLGDARLVLVDVSGGVGAGRRARLLGPLAQAASLPLAAPVLAAGPGQPPIIARRGWAQGMARPRVAPEYGSVRMAFVHHTENPNGYSPGEVPSMLRAIYAFHRYGNGWNDIGYNFVVDSYGRIFEARAGGIDESVVGAHAGGYNLVSSGVAVLGSFMGAPISTPARRALERLLAWKLSLHGVPAQGRVTVRVNPAGASYSRFPANARVSLPRIAGHRDGDSTDCPGDGLYRQLPGIRPRVALLAPRAASATLALQTPPPPSGQPPAGTPVGAETGGQVRILAGTFAFLDGTPIAGASVTVQRRTVAGRGEAVSEQTVAQAVTDAQGRWSLPATFAGSHPMSVRALCQAPAPVGAVVSDGLLLAPAEAPSVPPATPPPSAPAPAPPAS
jgi:N-acetylmuramoyl-L-alanine amidase